MKVSSRSPFLVEQTPDLQPALIAWFVSADILSIGRYSGCVYCHCMSHPNLDGLGDRAPGREEVSVLGRVPRHGCRKPQLS